MEWRHPSPWLVLPFSLPCLPYSPCSHRADEAFPLPHGSHASGQGGHPWAAVPHRPALATEGHLPACPRARLSSVATISSAQHPQLINSPCLYRCSWRGSCGLSQDPTDPVRAGGAAKPLATTHVECPVAPSPSMEALPRRQGLLTGGGRRVSGVIAGFHSTPACKALGPQGPRGSIGGCVRVVLRSQARW